jgi:SAM-dependent methyltransferase
MNEIDWEMASRNPDPCLICGSLAKQLLYPPTYTQSIAEAPAYFLEHRIATGHAPIVRCRDCGFVFTSPRFAKEDYDRIYKCIQRPLNIDGPFETARAARFRRLVAIVRKFVPQEATFLDFGCGDGSFLREFNGAGGRGFEIGAPGRRMVGSYEIVTGDWTSVAGTSIFATASFDFIVAFNVLEHLPQIEDDLALIRNVLKPGGLFFACIPNIESLTAKALGKYWGMLLLEHLWYFSPSTLKQLLSRYGLKCLTIRSLAYDAPIAHIATRLAQTLGIKGKFKTGPISRLVLPTPAGIMLGVFYRTT